ncbi:MAG: DUF302 domain-containing protein [Candidatus Thiosymbion ectosymbiont of Robbea hypermnestra]|nr:DUF302 domain-containing protein [Candidatus Thiosymbion ectosymbiont of Robbea hypermnestra]
MKFIRNLLALIGLLTLLVVVVAAIRLGPMLAEFDHRFLAVYGEFAGKLLETGDPGVSMTWSVPVDPGLTAEDVVASMKSIAISRNFLFVGESPFYKQVEAITGEDYRYVNFLSFCDAQVGKRMLEYRDHYSGFMPCRLALVEDKSGRLRIYTMNLDLMIHGGRELPADLKADAMRVRETIRAVMEGAARGEF